MRHFSVMALIVGNACCFRIMGVAKRNGGGLVGAVYLVAVFAKKMISVDCFIRERTPLGVLGLVEKDGAEESRRPLGLRASGCGILIMRRCLLLMTNLLRTDMRQGLKRKWTAVCGFRNPPWPP